MTHITNREKEVLEIAQENRDVKNLGYNFFLVCLLASKGVHLDPLERQALLDMPSIESYTRAFRKLVKKGEIVLTDSQRRKRHKKAEQIHAELSPRTKSGQDIVYIYDDQGRAIPTTPNRGYYR